MLTVLDIMCSYSPSSILLHPAPCPRRLHGMDSAADFLVLHLTAGFGPWGAQANQREKRESFQGICVLGSLPAGSLESGYTLSWRPQLHSGGPLLPVLVSSGQQMVKVPWICDCPLQFPYTLPTSLSIFSLLSSPKMNQFEDVSCFQYSWGFLRAI